MTIPPGISVLVTTISQASFLPLTLGTIDHFFLRPYGYHNLPKWVTVVTCLLSPLAAFSIKLMSSDLLVYYKAKRAGAVLPPHNPTWVPGAIHRVLVAVKEDTAYLGDILEERTRILGHTFNLRTLFTNHILTTEPEHIKLILATDFDHYEKGARVRKLLDPLLGVGVFNSDGAMWKFHRGMTRPFFSKDRISHFDIFDRHAADAIKQVKERMRQGYAVDVQDVVSRFTLDSATEFLFGMDVRSLSAGLNYPPSAPVSSPRNHPANKFADAFLTAQSVIAKRMLSNELAWKFLEFGRDRVVEPMAIIGEVLDPIVENAIKKKGEKGSSPAGDDLEGETLLSHLVNLTDDPKLIRDETLNILIAGRDTTACTLTFMLYMLSQTPGVLKKLRQEILDHVGPSARPTHEDLRNMKYLRATINETLRLFPPVPYNFRHATEDVIWPGPPGGQPFFIPAGTRCVYSVYVMHRRTDLWGPDALEFDPDRFLDERKRKYLLPNPFIFLPFNAGPRICLGQQFAYNEMSFMMIRILQAFEDITWDPEASPQSVPPLEWAESDNLRKREEKVWPLSHLTMYAKDGYWVKFKEAEH